MAFDEVVNVGGVNFTIDVDLSSFESRLEQAEQIARQHSQRIQQTLSQVSAPKAGNGQPATAATPSGSTSTGQSAPSFTSLQSSIDALRHEQASLAQALREVVAALKTQSSAPASFPSMGSSTPPTSESFRNTRIESESGQPVFMPRRMSQPAITQRQLPQFVTGGMSPHAGAPMQIVAPPPPPHLPPSLVSTPGMQVSQEQQGAENIAEQLRKRDEDVSRKIRQGVERRLAEATRPKRRPPISEVGYQLPLFEGLAAGGPTQSGKSYWVGEKGPEIFTPGQAGYVTPRQSGDKPSWWSPASELPVAAPLQLENVRNAGYDKRFGFRSRTARISAEQPAVLYRAVSAKELSDAVKRGNWKSRATFTAPVEGRTQFGHYPNELVQTLGGVDSKTAQEEYYQSRLRETQRALEARRELHANEESGELSSEGKREYERQYSTARENLKFFRNAGRPRTFDYLVGADISGLKIRQMMSQRPISAKRGLIGDLGLGVGVDEPISLERIKSLHSLERNPETGSGELGHDLTAAFQQRLARMQHRAEGGPTGGVQPYIVGEKGPELFVPRQAGYVFPNNSAQTKSFLHRAEGGPVEAGGAEAYVRSHMDVPGFTLRRELMATYGLSNVDASALLIRLGVQGISLPTQALSTAVPVTPSISPTTRRRVRRETGSIGRTRTPRVPEPELSAPAQLPPSEPAEVRILSDEEISALTIGTAIGGDLPAPVQTPQSPRRTPAPAQTPRTPGQRRRQKITPAVAANHIIEQAGSTEAALKFVREEMGDPANAERLPTIQEVEAELLKRQVTPQDTQPPAQQVTRRQQELLAQGAQPPGGGKKPPKPPATPPPPEQPGGPTPGFAALQAGYVPPAQAEEYGTLTGGPGLYAERQRLRSQYERMFTRAARERRVTPFGPQGPGGPQLPSELEQEVPAALQNQRQLSDADLERTYGPGVRQTLAARQRIRVNAQRQAARDTQLQQRDEARRQAVQEREMQRDYQRVAAQYLPAGQLQTISNIFSGPQPSGIARTFGAQTPAQQYVTQQGQLNAARLQELGLSQQVANQLGREQAARVLLSDATKRNIEHLTQGRLARQDEVTASRRAAASQLQDAGVDVPAGEGGEGGGRRRGGLFGLSTNTLVRTAAGFLGVNIGINIAAGAARQLHDIIAAGVDESIRFADTARLVSANWGSAASTVTAGFQSFRQAPLVIGTQADFQQATGALAPLAQQYQLTTEQVQQLTTASAQLATIHGVQLPQSMQVAQEVMRGNLQAGQALGINLVDQYGALRTNGLTWDQMVASMGPAAATQRVLSEYLAATNTQLANQAGSSTELQTNVVSLGKAWADFNTQIAQMVSGPLTPFLGELAQLIKDINTQLLGLHSSAPSTGTSIQGRQHGGDAKSKKAYLVGENGPELFVPDQSGYVFAHSDKQTKDHIEARQEGGRVSSGGPEYPGDKLQLAPTSQPQLTLDQTAPSALSTVAQYKSGDSQLLPTAPAPRPAPLPESTPTNGTSQFIQEKVGGSIGRAIVGTAVAANPLAVPFAAPLAVAGPIGAGIAGLLAPDIARKAGQVAEGPISGLAAGGQAGIADIPVLGGLSRGIIGLSQALDTAEKSVPGLRGAIQAISPEFDSVTQALSKGDAAVVALQTPLDQLPGALGNAARAIEGVAQATSAIAAGPPKPPIVADQQDRITRGSAQTQAVSAQAAALEGVRLQQSRAQLASQEASSRVARLNAGFELQALNRRAELNQLTAQSIDIENQRAPLLLAQQGLQDQINIRTQANLEVTKSLLQARLAEVPTAAGLEQNTFTQQRAQLRAQVSISDLIQGRAPTFDLTKQLGALYTTALQRPALALADLEKQHTVNQNQFAQTTDQLTKSIDVIPLQEMQQIVERNLDLLNEQLAANQAGIEWINRQLELAKVQSDAATQMIQASVDLQNAVAAEADTAQKLAAAALGSGGGGGATIGTFALEMNIFNPPSTADQTYLNTIAAVVQSNTIDAIHQAFKTSPSRVPSQTSGARGAGPFGAS